MNFGPVGRHSHDLAKVNRLCGGFAPLRCRNPPEPVRFDIEHRGDTAIETPGAKKPRRRAPGRGYKNFGVF